VRHRRAIVARKIRTGEKMHIKSKKILAVAFVALIAAVAVGGWAKATMFAANAAKVERSGAGIDPFDIMLASDVKKLPLEEIKEGECPARC
jgi:hypothetical protein